MLKLMRFELRKLFRLKSLYICFGVSLAILVLGALLTKSVADDFSVRFSTQALTLSALTDSSFTVLLGIFVALYYCDDNSNHTIKNVIAKGYSRFKIFVTKYLVSLAVSLIIAVLFFLISFLFGVASGGNGDKVEGFVGRIFLLLLAVAGFHAVYFSISAAVGKAGGSVALNVLGALLVVTLLDLIASLAKLDFSFSEYWLNSLINGLPENELTSGFIAKAIILPIAYAAVFLTGSFFIIRRREV